MSLKILLEWTLSPWSFLNKHNKAYGELVPSWKWEQMKNLHCVFKEYLKWPLSSVGKIQYEKIKKAILAQKSRRVSLVVPPDRRLEEKGGTFPKDSVRSPCPLFQCLLQCFQGEMLLRSLGFVLLLPSLEWYTRKLFYHNCLLKCSDMGILKFLPLCVNALWYVPYNHIPRSTHMNIYKSVCTCTHTHTQWRLCRIFRNKWTYLGCYLRKHNTKQYIEFTKYASLSWKGKRLKYKYLLC